MGLLNVINEARIRGMAKLVTVADAGAEPWDILRELGDIGANARPVVIQGGFTTDAYLYDPLKRLLEARGFDVSVTGFHLHGWAPVERDAAHLAKVVEEASARSLARGGDGLVTILGHSKGGLSSRWYLQRMGGAEHVAQLITLGTPHNGVAPYGSTLAAITAHAPWNPASVRQLSRGSSLTRELNADLPAFMARTRAANPQFRMVSIAGDVDLPGLRGTDGLVKVADTHLDDRIAGVHNLVLRGGHHISISGQVGQHEPTLRAAMQLAAGSPFADAATGAALVTGTT